MRLPPLVCPLVFLCRLARSSCAAAGPSSGTPLCLLRRLRVDKGERRRTPTGESRLRAVQAGRRRSCRQRARALRKALCQSFLGLRLGLLAPHGQRLLLLLLLPPPPPLLLLLLLLQQWLLQRLVLRLLLRRQGLRSRLRELRRCWSGAVWTCPSGRVSATLRCRRVR